MRDNIGADRATGGEYGSTFPRTVRHRILTAGDQVVLDNRNSMDISFLRRGQSLISFSQRRPGTPMRQKHSANIVRAGLMKFLAQGKKKDGEIRISFHGPSVGNYTKRSTYEYTFDIDMEYGERSEARIKRAMSRESMM